MHITQSQGIYRLWDDNMNVIAKSESYKKMQYLLHKNDKNRVEHTCPCLLCKNGSYVMCHTIGAKTILQHHVDNERWLMK